MKQHLITIAVLLSVFIFIVGGIFLAAKHSTVVSETDNSTSTPLLDLQTWAPAIESVTATTPATQGPTPLAGAVEIDASSSAAISSARHVLIILTNGRSFQIELYPDLAPIAVANFLNKVRTKFYNGLLFFRVEKNQQGTAVAQTGDPTNTGQGGGVMQAEYNKKPFTAGSVGIARGKNRDLNSDSQFFIVVQDLLTLNEEYTNIGDVATGLDVVQNLHEGQPIRSIDVLD